MSEDAETRMVTLLVVDDNDDDVILLQESLKDLPAAQVLRIAHDGDEALAYLRREGEFGGAPRPSLVLLDINMPRKNGFEVLGEMKNDPELRSIPVVILSTSRSEDDVALAYGSGACTFVSKPVNLDRLRLMTGHLVRYWSTVSLLPKVPQ